MSAVIEFRLGDPIDDADLRRLTEKFGKLKWKSEELIEFQLNFAGRQAQPPVQRVTGFKFTSPDADRVINVDRQNYSVTVLPPYLGWEKFLESFYEYLPLWKKIVGRRPLSRIGVRYVNRFDIPCVQGEMVRLQDYMVFTTTEPDILDEPVRGLMMQVNSGISADKLQVNLGTVGVMSPVVDHVGVSLDIDLYREAVDVPQSENDIREFLNLARRRRTEIFEKCITDRTRQLIS